MRNKSNFNKGRLNRALMLMATLCLTAMPGYSLRRSSVSARASALVQTQDTDHFNVAPMLDTARAVSSFVSTDGGVLIATGAAGPASF